MIVSINKMNKILLYISLFFLLFIPKTNIINFSFSYVGAKPEDVLFFVLFLYYIIAAYLFDYQCNLGEYPIRWIVGFVCINILFVIANDIEIKNVAFIVRYTEYFMFLWFGFFLYSSQESIEENKILDKFIFFAFLFWVMFSLMMEGVSIDGRKSSIFAHPTEFAGVVVFLMWVYGGGNEKSLKKIIIYMLGCLLIFLSGTRSALVAIVFLFFFYNKQRIGIKIVCLSIVILISGYGFFSGTDIDEENSKLARLNSALSLESIEVAYDIYSSADPSSLEEIKSPEVTTNDGDASVNARITKWGIIVANSIDHYLIWGCGAGNIGEAIDGFYVRVLGENGIIGLMFYMLAIICLFKNSNNDKRRRFAKIGTIGLIIEGCFIDIFYFSRVACTFWFFWGMIIAKNNKIRQGELETEK